MSHASDATKAWVSAIPKKNADGNVRIGYQSAGSNSASTGNENTCVGNYAGFKITSGAKMLYLVMIVVLI